MAGRTPSRIPAPLHVLLQQVPSPACHLCFWAPCVVKSVGRKLGVCWAPCHEHQCQCAVAHAELHCVASRILLYAIRSMRKALSDCVKCQMGHLFCCRSEPCCSHRIVSRCQYGPFEGLTAHQVMVSVYGWWFTETTIVLSAARSTSVPPPPPPRFVRPHECASIHIKVCQFLRLCEQCVCLRQCTCISVGPF